MADTRRVEVVTPVGDYRVALGPNHHVQALLAEVLARMGRRYNRGGVGQYDLVMDDQRLEPLHTLASAGVEDATRLHLEVNPTGGI